MSDCMEVLFVSDGNGRQTANCFNPNVGTTLMTYNGSGGAKRTLSVIGNDYLISADLNKPILNVWSLNSQECSHNLRMVISGKPSCLTVSLDGYYCIAGIDEKIYIWQISCGALLNTLSKHYQKVNKIVFTDDSSHFLTAGDDGLVCMWKLGDVIVKQSASPVYTFSHHSLPITDIFVGSGNLKSRLFTVSSDQTCKIYCLGTGELLLSIVFSYVLTAVTVNELETELFVGTYNGKIEVFHLEPYPRGLECHTSNETNLEETLIGHTKTVTCLSSSLDGVTLASGSEDEKVFLWNIPSKQLIRSFEMKGPITNLFFHFASSNIFTDSFKPQLVINKFEKTSTQSDKSLVANVWVHQDLKPLSNRLELSDKRKSEPQTDNQLKTFNDEFVSLKNEISKLKEANKQLYQFAMKEIIQNPYSIGMKK
ncbi:WD-repeat protein, putative [Pediculus humanus corporis]|uniref:WD-repeat protein, putative n=1 Tax=Pediculus humanus subsp. corporis TaxID=121224 RepID=E0V9A7_PEDHC|nr:WD-repeat protein, putative [Pediculus humanus corporis]EEB09963.1 WD-repeat protein, putative [Pediculus humanus corporis]